MDEISLRRSGYLPTFVAPLQNAAVNNSTNPIAMYRQTVFTTDIIFSTTTSCLFPPVKIHLIYPYREKHYAFANQANRKLFSATNCKSANQKKACIRLVGFTAGLYYLLPLGTNSTSKFPVSIFQFPVSYNN